MKLQITPVDRNLEENGVWTSYMGVQLLIARSNSTRFKAAFRRLTKPYQDDLEKGSLPEEISAQVLSEALSEAILLGWKGFYVEEQEIEYSKENAANLLLNDSDCREFVVDFSGKLDNYIKEERDKIMGE